MVPKHLRKSDESLGDDQESLMASYLELQEKIINDKSILRQPIDTGVRGVRDLMKAVVGGTQELQELLLNECTIIYECKICRNLFRSLANFISHKRIYCIQNFTYFTGATNKQKSDLFQENDILQSDLINCSKDVNLNETKVWLTNNKIVPNNIKTEENDCLKPTRRIKISPVKITRSCDIAKIADGLNRRAREESFKPCDEDQETFFSSDIAERVMMRRCKLQKKAPSELDKFNNCTNEFFQGSKEYESCNARDAIPLEVIDRLVPCNEAVLQENGKFRVTPQGMKLENNTNLQKYKCSLCETHFITEQTFARHVQIHHKERICYPCPICRTYFPSPGSTYKHLSKDHHKTEQQIRRLRPKVLAKARKRKLVDGSPKLGKESKEEEPQRLNENWEGVLRCVGCGKLFNRQAVLRVHLTSCKESPSAKPSPSKPPSKPKPALPPPSACKPEQRKSGILVRRDYCKKFNSDAKSYSSNPTNSVTGSQVKGNSLKRVNKWRTVLKKLQSRTGLDVNEKAEARCEIQTQNSGGEPEADLKRVQTTAFACLTIGGESSGGMKLRKYPRLPVEGKPIDKSPSPTANNDESLAELGKYLANPSPAFNCLCYVEKGPREGNLH